MAAYGQAGAIDYIPNYFRHMIKQGRSIAQPNLFIYFLIPTMILALLSGINFQYLGGLDLLIGLVLLALCFLTIFPFRKKSKDPDELLDTQEKLILAQEEIKRLNQRIEELEQLDQSKNDFLKILAHDLKSPVNNILGLHEIVKLSENADKKEMETLIRKMADAGSNVKMLIDNLMSWCINNQGRVTPNIEKVSVLEVVEKSWRIYGNLAEDKQIDLKIDISKDIDLKADRDHVFTILRNLINNALKFTHKGGEVVISASTRGRDGVLTVSDTGVGMAEEKVDELLHGRSKNQKVAHSLIGTRGELGNGLGLNICCDLVAMNNGKMEIESILGQGTIFSVSFPIFR